MNHSIYSADRTTHMKIVAAALVASMGVAGLGIAVRINTNNEYSKTAHVIIKIKERQTRFAVRCRRPESSGNAFANVSVGRQSGVIDHQLIDLPV